MSLQIVTVADKEPTAPYLVRGFSAFKASCARYGFDPIILGWKRDWKGLGSKPKLLKRAIEDGTVTADRIIFADAFDVVFANDPNDIDHLAQNFFPHHRIVWNAEKACFPEAGLAEYFPKTASPWKYLNSGLSIGYTSDYLECLSEMDADKIPDDEKRFDGTWFHSNDQTNWQHRFLFGQCGAQVKMALDTQCVLFQTLTDCLQEEFDIQDGRVMNLVTPSCPMAFHANGGAKTGTLWEPILQALAL